jgi:hypothetical protein
MAVQKRKTGVVAAQLFPLGALGGPEGLRPFSLVRPVGRESNG